MKRAEGCYNTQQDKVEMPNYGLVSIVMPNYNGSKYLEETVRSVIAQTYQNWELLFVDDCSSDDSLELVRAFGDERIRIFQNEKNSGAAVSRNLALKMAKGRWIAFLDSDDLWLPDKLAEQLGFMVSNGYHFSYTPYSQIDETGKPLNVEVTGPHRVNKRKMYRYDYVGCLTVIYDREHIGLVQVEPSLLSRNDYAIWLEVCEHCDCFLFEKNLARYRIRKNSLSHRGLKRKLYSQYRLFRYGRKMGIVRALWHTLVNMVFGVLKKIVFVKQTKEDYKELKPNNLTDADAEFETEEQKV